MAGNIEFHPEAIVEAQMARAWYAERSSHRLEQIMAPKPVTLEDVVMLARRLPPRDKLRLVERVLPDLDGALAADSGRIRRRSLLGLCADLGQAPSGEDIDALRQEMWQGFPREGI